MVAIKGLGGIPEPKPERPAKVRNERDNPASSSVGGGQAASKDGLQISSEAQAAAEVARLIQVTQAQNDVRADKVEGARQRIEQGEYKNPDVVAKVAERINRIL